MPRLPKPTKSRDGLMRVSVRADIRLTPEAYEVFLDAAKRSGLTPSQYADYCLRMGWDTERDQYWETVTQEGEEAEEARMLQAEETWHDV